MAVLHVLDLVTSLAILLMLHGCLLCTVRRMQLHKSTMTHSSNSSKLGSSSFTLLLSLIDCIPVAGGSKERSVGCQQEAQV